MSSPIDGSPRISITGKRHELLIGRTVLRLLGQPSCLCVLKSEDKQSIAITPCSNTEPLSFQIPISYYENTNSKFRVYSKPFTEELLYANGWDDQNTHHVEGIYQDAKNAVFFPVKVL